MCLQRVRSEIHPDPSRLTTPQPSMIASILASLTAPNPRSVACNDVHLRHGHGRTTAYTRHADKALQRCGTHVVVGLTALHRAKSSVFWGRLGVTKRQRQHDDEVYHASSNMFVANRTDKPHCATGGQIAPAI